MQRGTFRRAGTDDAGKAIWGAHVEGAKPKPGDTVELYRKDGSVREAVIDEVGDEGPWGWECTITYVGMSTMDPDYDDDYGMSWEDFAGD